MYGIINYKQTLMKEETMKILCIGDIVGDAGVLALHSQLSLLKKQYEADLCIANGENADSSGVGLSQAVAEELQSIGADIITTGNHALRKASPTLYEENPHVLCPANYYWAQKEYGMCHYTFGRYVVCVMNIAGIAYLDAARSPFDTFDELYETAQTPFIIIDFHAESTAEKLAFAHYVDGRASVVFGTHTHVQTNDAQILPNGTGYVTDIGMTGPTQSVIGVKPELAIRKQKLHMPVRFEVANTLPAINGAVFTLDDNGECIKVSLVQL